MKKYKGYVFAAMLVLATFAAEAQEYGSAYYTGSDNIKSPPTPRQRLINWRPAEDTDTQRRYTIAIQPIELLNFGLMLDFELELDKGKWLQLNLTGHYAPQYDFARYKGDYVVYPYKGGWSNFLNQDYFERLGGIGFGAAYKRIFSQGGWYWSAGIYLNYYDVTEWILDDYGPSGHTHINKSIRSRIFKYGFNINIGKHFALSRNLFLDTYIGLGLEGAHSDGLRLNWKASMLSFRYSGVYVSSGLRIGWMWPNKK